MITVEFSDLGPNTGGFPVTRSYHQLTHHGKVASYIKELSIIERFHTKQFGRFLDKLSAVREPNDRTLLDNTMALLGSGMGNASSHSNKNIPLLLAGGGFKHQGHLQFESGKTPASSCLFPCSKVWHGNGFVQSLHWHAERASGLMRSMRAIVLLAALSLGAESAVAAELPASVPVFVKRYCMKCHDADSEKGDRNFERFLAQPGKAEHHELLKEILDQLNLGEMPPRKKNVAQPLNAERRQMVAVLADYLAAVESSKVPTATVMRRLTRYEYNYTLRDLLGVDTIAADATRLFPADATSHGFPNFGPVQALSDVQPALHEGGPNLPRSGLGPRQKQPR